MSKRRFADTPLGRCAEDAFQRIACEIPADQHDLAEAAVVQAITELHTAAWDRLRERLRLSDEELERAMEAFYEIMGEESPD